MSLKRGSIILVTLSKEVLWGELGELSENLFKEEIDERLKIALGIK